MPENRDALEALTRAHVRSVAFAVKTNVMYDGSLDEESPVHGSAVSFKIGDYLHIFEKFDANWWVGRKVKENTDIGFVPSPDRLEQLILQKAPVGKLDRVKTGTAAPAPQSNGNGNAHTSNGEGGQTGEEGTAGVRVSAPPVIEKKKGFLGKKCETLSPYDVVPIMRPVVMVGPSLKGYEVTDMLQKAVFEFLKNKFEGRVIITHVGADLSLGKTSVLNNPSNRKLLEKSSLTRAKDISEVQAEIERIFDLSKNMKIILIDCDTINHPAQLADTSLAPIMVYLKITSTKVLQRLIKSRGATQSKNMNIQIVATEKLDQCEAEQFDLILDEFQLEDACEHVAEYLELYWRATRPPRQPILD